MTEAAVVLLTQVEAARLVRCSTGKLARERRLGRLAYIPGRPVLLRLGDVLDWLERRRVAADGEATGKAGQTVTTKPYHPVRAARLAALHSRRKQRG